jgi:peptidoglycan/LPS O-acetylase OafA/YrhL
MLSLVIRGGRTVESLVPTARRTFLACAAVLGAIWLNRGWDTEDWTMTTVGFTLLAGLFGATIVLVLAAPASSRTARVFGGPSLTFLGKYSYGLYVFHFALEPTFRHYLSINLLTDRVFHHYWPARLTYMLLATGISIAAAWLSWHLYEKQFLKLKRYFETRPARRAEPVTMPLPEQAQFRRAA